jgi:hypothetical protein
MLPSVQSGWINEYLIAPFAFPNSLIISRFFFFQQQFCMISSSAYDLYALHIQGRDTVVSIATRYGLDGPRIESRWGKAFPHPSRTALRPTQPPITMGTGSFPRVKRPECGVDHPPPSSAEVKERVVLYLYYPSGPSWPVLGWTLTLPCIFCRIPFYVITKIVSGEKYTYVTSSSCNFLNICRFRFSPFILLSTLFSDSLILFIRTLFFRDRISHTGPLDPEYGITLFWNVGNCTRRHGVTSCQAWNL